MAYPISTHIWNTLICYYCGQDLHKTSTGAACPQCNLHFPYTDSGSLDLRLQSRRRYTLDFELGTPLLPEEGFQFNPLALNAQPEVDFSGTSIPRHLTRETLSYFPRARTQESLMLDLGCGGGIHREVCERAGFEWVGLDYDAPEAPLLGDAHSLPFKNETFEFILCVTVLQYIRYPFVMMREAYRVLKPHGKLIGTVAFLEPSHGTSFYHHTHLGAFNSLTYGGFTIERLAPSREWSALMALASMGLFYGLPRFMSQSIVFPLQLLHNLWWRVGGMITGRELEQVRLRHFTGSFTFIASKGAI
jgi:SAM-dependent methyltransferase